MLLDDDEEETAAIFRELSKLENKGELGEAIACYIERIPIYDIAAMFAHLGNIVKNMDVPPKLARDYKQLLKLMLYDPYQRILSMKSDGSFGRMKEPIRDRELFTRFCEMMVSSQSELDEIYQKYSGNDLGRKFGYHSKIGGLIECFTMFVADQPGHPVGMPFPGGFKVENKNGVYYCPVRDKEKDVKYAMCNFCPAKQADIG